MLVNLSIVTPHLDQSICCKYTHVYIQIFTVSEEELQILEGTDPDEGHVTEEVYQFICVCILPICV